MDIFELMKLIADLGTAGGLILVMLVLIRREQKQDEADALKNQMQEERQSKEQDTYTSIITQQSEWLVHERERSDRLMQSEQAHRERMAELLSGIGHDQTAHGEILASVRDQTQQTTQQVQSGFGLVDEALGEIKRTLEAINRNVDTLNTNIAAHEENARQRYDGHAANAQEISAISGQYLELLTAIRQQVDAMLNKLITREVPAVHVNPTPETTPNQTHNQSNNQTNNQKEKESTHETDA